MKINSKFKTQKLKLRILKKVSQILISKYV